MPESYKYPSATKCQLEPTHRELVQRGFLSRADFEEHGRDYRLFAQRWTS